MVQCPTVVKGSAQSQGDRYTPTEVERDRLLEVLDALDLARKELIFATAVLGQTNLGNSARLPSWVGGLFSTIDGLGDALVRLEGIDAERPTPPGRKLSREPEIRCMDCHVEVLGRTRVEQYMVHNDVWNQAFPGPAGHLCIECLSERLGRNLRWNDFTECPLNNAVMLVEAPALRRLKVERLWMTKRLEHPQILIARSAPEKQAAVRHFRAVLKDLLRELPAAETVCEDVDHWPLREDTKAQIPILVPGK